MVETQGAVQLRRLSYDALRSLGFADATIYAWRNGTRRPKPLNQEILERHFGIERKAWLTKEELRALSSRGRAGSAAA